MNYNATGMKVIALLLIVHILSESISEGLYDRGKKDPVTWKGLNITLILSKLIQVIFIVFLLWYFGLRDWATFYVCARIAIFNYTNMFAAGREEPLGKTDLWDIVLYNVTMRQKWLYWLLIAACAFIAYEQIYPL